MSVKKNKNGKGWTARLRHHYKDYKKQGFRTKKDAELWEAQMRQTLNTPKEKEIPTISFQTLATEYLKDCELRMQKNTWRQKARVYRIFLLYIGGDRDMDQVSTYNVSRFLAGVAQEKGNKSANRYRRDLVALYNWGIRKRIIRLENPCTTIEKYPEDPTEKYIPPSEDIHRVRMAAKREEKDLIDCVYHLAARIGEIKRLEWGDVNFEKRWVRLYTRKRRGGELQMDYQPMNASLYKVLNSRWETRDKSSNKVFLLGDHQIRYMMGRLCRRAGVKRFGFHAIRHHVISVINDSGKANMKQIQLFARHKRQLTTENYLHNISRNMFDTVSILDGLADDTEGGFVHGTSEK